MRRGITPLLIAVCLAGLFVAFYGRAIFQGEQFGYRDAGHYYYPLHQRVQAEWDAGRWPLWEPEENSGMPLLGNPTAAVLYPGKLIFAAFPYPLAARLYIMSHSLLAFAAMLALLRNWGTSWVGSTLGSLAYAFGGPVVFQYCNIIYLVGAAWLPLGLRAVDRWLRLGRRIALAELAVVLAMEVVGGDPESAYLTGVCAAGYAVLLARRRAGAKTRIELPSRSRSARRWILLGCGLSLIVWVVATLAVAHFGSVLMPRPAGKPQPSSPWAAWLGSLILVAWGLVALALGAHWRRLRGTGGRSALVPMLFGLVIAAAVAASSTAAQLLPVMEFIAQSNRAAHDVQQDIYGFSLEPFRVVELIWPNIFGTPFRGNKLWIAVLPPGEVNVNVWVPTLYVGGLTLVLALGGGSLPFDGDSGLWRTWMLGITAVSLLGGFGEYCAPIGAARLMAGLASLSGLLPTDVASRLPSGFLRDGDGGVYWLLATFFPGFGHFRYPSKLLTLTVLGLAALAAQGWDALATGDPGVRRRIAVCAAALLAPTLAALVLGEVGKEPFRTWLEARQLTSTYGPFDAAGAVSETLASLLQAAVVLIVSLILALRLAVRYPATAAVLALAVMSVDLAVANARLIITVPQSTFDAIPEAVSIIERAEREKPMPGPYRVYRVPIWSPFGWNEMRSTDRVRDFVAWESRTAEPKFGINHQVQYTRTLGVTQLYDYEWFFGTFPFRAREQAARFLRVEPGTKLLAHARRAFDMWNSRYFILPYRPRWDDGHRAIASFLHRTERIYPAADAFEGAGAFEQAFAWIMFPDYQVRRNLDVFPRAWVVHESRRLPTFRGLSRAGREQPMEELLFSNDITWPDPARIVYDPHHVVWLEDSVRLGLGEYLSGRDGASREDVSVVRYQPDRVELDAVLESPGMVVLADIYYPGWSLTIDGQAASVYRANRMMRGAAVAAGHHRLIYTYRPASFRIGLVVSGLGLLGLILLAVWSVLPSRRVALTVSLPR